MPSPRLGHLSGSGPQKSSPALGQNLATGRPVRVKPFGSLVSEPEPQKLGSWEGGAKKRKTTPRRSSGPKPRDWSASPSKTLASEKSENFEWKPGEKFLATESTARVKTLHFALRSRARIKKPFRLPRKSGEKTGVSLVPSHSHSFRGRGWGVRGFFERGSDGKGAGWVSVL